MNCKPLLSKSVIAGRLESPAKKSASHYQSTFHFANIGLEPQAGFQPATPSLEGSCSDASELLGLFPHIDLICYGPNDSIHLVKIDTVDLPRVLAVSSIWRVANFYPRGRRLYAYCRKNRRTVYLHRVVTQAPIGLEVDHHYHHSLDNRKASLRVVTHGENQKNRIDARKGK